LHKGGYCRKSNTAADNSTDDKSRGKTLLPALHEVDRRWHRSPARSCALYASDSTPEPWEGQLSKSRTRMRTSCGATPVTWEPSRNPGANRPKQSSAIPAQATDNRSFQGLTTQVGSAPSGCTGRYSPLRDYPACICQTSRCWRHAPPVGPSPII